MATITFAHKIEETPKAVKLIIRESVFNPETMQYTKEISHWIPKSVITINGNTAEVADWFYNKNMTVDTYGAFMKSLANS